MAKAFADLMMASHNALLPSGLPPLQSASSGTPTQRKTEKSNRARNGRRARIKQALERLYEKYNHRRLIEPDPLQFVYHFSEPADREIAGFLAAALAYGRVQQIEKSLGRLFALMGKSPYAFVRRFDAHARTQLRDFKHRFTTGEDLADLLELLQRVLEEFGSLEAYFARSYGSGDATVIPALSQFCDSLCAAYARKHGGRVSSGLKYLLASPTRHSASKRLNLFLRWMVRDDDVDTGLWTSVDKARLIVPVDVHVGRLCKILGFHDRKTISLAAAMEITAGFADIEPADPVRYDFALSRVGIVENCDGRHRPACADCELLEFCRENPYG
jgi:uncharacterized protein (TIGR02757 family)